MGLFCEISKFEKDQVPYAGDLDNGLYNGLYIESGKRDCWVVVKE